MTQTDKAKSAIKAAREMADKHLGGTRDASLEQYLDDQIRRFRDILEEMYNDLECGTVTNRLATMGHAIVDGWPLESELGELIVKAEDQYCQLGK